MNNKELLEVLQFADDSISIEPYEHCHDEACELHEKLRKIINELVYKAPQEDYNRPELKKQDLDMSLEQFENADFNGDDARVAVQIYKNNEMWKIIKFIKSQIKQLAECGDEYGEYDIPCAFQEQIINILKQDKFNIPFIGDIFYDSAGEGFVTLGISWK